MPRFLGYESSAFLSEALARSLLSPRWPGAAANSLVHRVPDPITNRYRFKLGKGRISEIVESPYKSSFDEMTFKPRTIA